MRQALGAIHVDASHMRRAAAIAAVYVDLLGRPQDSRTDFVEPCTSSEAEAAACRLGLQLARELGVVVPVMCDLDSVCAHLKPDEATRVVTFGRVRNRAHRLALQHLRCVLDGSREP